MPSTTFEKKDLPVFSNASLMELQPISKVRESFGIPCKMIDRLDFSYLEEDSDIIG